MSHNDDHNETDDSLDNETLGLSTSSILSPLSSNGDFGSLRIASDLLSRVNFFSQNGLTSFEGQRDLYTILGYKQNISPQDYRQRYRRGGIAKRLVNVIPKMAWSGGVDVIENENPEIITSFETDLNVIFENINLTSKLLRTDILAGLGQYSTAIIGVKDGKDLSRPLEKRASNNPSQLIFLTPVHQDQATIKEYVDDISNERFGLPLTYEVTFSRDKKSLTKDSKLVHWTRVLHHLHNPLEDDVFGDPDLEDVWNLLDDLYKLIGGGSEAAWKQMAAKTLFDIDREMVKVDPKDVEKKEEELEEMVHGLRQFIMTKGVTPKTFGASVYDFSNNAHTVMQHIAGTKGIALRVIMGTEEGKLAGDQDRENVKFTVSQWCDHHAIPLVRQFVDRMIRYGFVRTPKDGKYQVIMGARVADLGELDKAALLVSYTQANRNQKLAGQPPVLSDSEIRDRTLGLKPLEEEDPTDDDGDDNDDSGTDADTDTKTTVPKSRNERKK